MQILIDVVIEEKGITDTDNNSNEHQNQYELFDQHLDETCRWRSYSLSRWKFEHLDKQLDGHSYEYLGEHVFDEITLLNSTQVNAEHVNRFLSNLYDFITLSIFDTFLEECSPSLF